MRDELKKKRVPLPNYDTGCWILDITWVSDIYYFIEEVSSNIPSYAKPAECLA
jgi:hypothetical protein